MINMKYLKELVADIKGKKELKGLDDSFVEKKLLSYLKSAEHNQDKDAAIRKLNDSKSYKQFAKSREHEFLMKNMRAELRKLYGVFILEDYGKRNEILDSIKYCEGDELCDLELHKKLLSLHKSTKERLEGYEEIFDNIFSIVRDFGHEKEKYIILDLGCGMNPVSSIFYRKRIKKYFASDVSEQDCRFIREYLKKMRIASEVFTIDLTEEKEYGKLKNMKADICLIFKTLDQLERVKRNISEKLLKAVDAEIIVVSFPTVSISGKNIIDVSKRGWFEKLLDRLGWKFEKFNISNELFYVFKRS